MKVAGGLFHLALDAGGLAFHVAPSQVRKEKNNKELSSARTETKATKKNGAFRGDSGQPAAMTGVKRGCGVVDASGGDIRPKKTKKGGSRKTNDLDNREKGREKSSLITYHHYSPMTAKKSSSSRKRKIK